MFWWIIWRWYLPCPRFIEPTALRSRPVSNQSNLQHFRPRPVAGHILELAKSEKKDAIEYVLKFATRMKVLTPLFYRSVGERPLILALGSALARARARAHALALALLHSPVTLSSSRPPLALYSFSRPLAALPRSTPLRASLRSLKCRTSSG